MSQWHEINSRFLAFFPGKSQVQIAELYGISQPTVSEWVSGRAQVPWEKLKDLVDTQKVCWNWLLEGLEPKYRAAALDEPETERGVFDTPGINNRFLSLFPDFTQKELAEYFGITQPVVSKWKTFDKQVPWDKLKHVVDSQGISWDWLLEGMEPRLLPGLIK